MLKCSICEEIITDETLEEAKMNGVTIFEDENGKIVCEDCANSME